MTASRIHRITPEDQPQFPCWLYNASHPSGKGWLWFPSWACKNRPEELGWLHWHPDQPTAPTETPEEGNDAELSVQEALNYADSGDRHTSDPLAVLAAEVRRLRAPAAAPQPSAEVEEMAREESETIYRIAMHPPEFRGDALTEMDKPGIDEVRQALLRFASRVRQTATAPVAQGEELRNAVNLSCSCGGGGPNDPHTCPACMVWHRMGSTSRSAKPSDQPDRWQSAETSSTPAAPLPKDVAERLNKASADMWADKDVVFVAQDAMQHALDIRTALTALEKATADRDRYLALASERFHRNPAGESHAEIRSELTRLRAVVDAADRMEEALGVSKRRFEVLGCRLGLDINLHGVHLQTAVNDIQSAESAYRAAKEKQTP